MVLGIKFSLMCSKVMKLLESNISSEAELQALVERLLAARDWRFYHVRDSRSVSHKSGKGFPDLVIMKPPYCAFIELKLDRGRHLSPDQADWMVGLKNCGLPAYVLYPDRLKQFKALITHPERYPERWVM